MATKKKTTKNPNPCKCIVGVNKELAAKGVAVTTGFSLSGRIWPLIAIESLKTQRPKSGIVLAATFCPFCGVDLRPPAAKAG